MVKQPRWHILPVTGCCKVKGRWWVSTQHVTALGVSRVGRALETALGGARGVLLWFWTNPRSRSHSPLGDLGAQACPAVSGSNFLPLLAEVFERGPENNFPILGARMLSLHCLCPGSWAHGSRTTRLVTPQAVPVNVCPACPSLRPLPPNLPFPCSPFL